MPQDQGYEKSAHLYDYFDTKQNLDFFYELLKDKKVILDIGAGTGRIAIHLAKKGLKVVCIEPSPAMCSQFSYKINKTPKLTQKITLINTDAKSFQLEENFPAAFLSGTFDHFLDSKERELSLMNINRHLETNGILIFDVFLGLMKDSPLKPAGVVKNGQFKYRRFVGSHITPKKQIEVLLVFEIYKNGNLVDKIVQNSCAAVTTRKETHQLLKKTGFTITNEYSDYEFTKFQKGDSLLIIKALKTG